MSLELDGLLDALESYLPEIAVFLSTKFDIFKTCAPEILDDLNDQIKNVLINAENELGIHFSDICGLITVHTINTLSNLSKKGN